MEESMKNLLYVLWCLAALMVAEPAALADSTLYATDVTYQQLYILSKDDASATLVGPFGVAGYMAGLAYDAIDGILFGSTTGTDRLYAIDPSSGAVTLIGPLGFPLMHALAFDNYSGTLYGAYGGDGGLYQIDTTSGAATLIGPIGFSSVSGMAFDPQTNILYGITDGPSNQSHLITIDPSTGQGTLVATIRGSHYFQGISFDPDTGVLYGIDNGAAIQPRALYTIDADTGDATLVGHVSLDNPLDLQFIPGD
jgi:DNA-binding beta-propeller fold protein YncE